MKRKITEVLNTKPDEPPQKRAELIIRKRRRNSTSDCPNRKIKFVYQCDLHYDNCNICRMYDCCGQRRLYTPSISRECEYIA
jgi:hypothetical protein